MWHAARPLSCPARSNRWLENGAQDPDRRKRDHHEQQRKSQDIAHALLLHSAGCFGFVEVNLIALTFHRRLLEAVTWVDAEGATGVVQKTDGVELAGLDRL